MKITEKIKSFEDACKALGINKNLPEVSALPENHQKAITAHYKLIIIAEALNEGWKPDWNNYEEYKYHPWFVMHYYSYSYFFSYSDFSFKEWADNTSISLASSHLCFKSSELATYIAKTFTDMFREYFLLEQKE